MIKKFLSFVALSATLIAPVFADEFVPLQYYEEIPATRMPTSTFSYSTRSIDSGYSSLKINEQNEVDCKVRQGIVEDELSTVEMYSRESSLKPKTIDEIFEIMKKGDNQEALTLFDSEILINCSLIGDNEEEYYAGPGGRRSPFDPSMKQLEDMAKHNKQAKKLVDEIGSFKNGNSISQSAKDAKKLSDKAADNFAKEKGYKDAHDLKYDIVGRKNISKYNIHVNKKTGESFLIDSKGNAIPIY